MKRKTKNQKMFKKLKLQTGAMHVVQAVPR